MKIQSAKAGIGTGRAGLQAASGLFSNAGLFNKGVKSFNPLDLDPYLLFDAQTSMIGTLENPTLDLDPSKQDTLDVITATRAGTATFTDANGNIATAPSDTVRVDHVDGVPMILVEPSATNLVDNSNSFSASGTAVKTTGFEAPDGTNNSTKISNIQDGDGEKAHCPLTSVSGSTQYSGSIYIKGTGGQTIRVQAKRATTGSFSGSGTQTITFDGTWQRVTNLTWTTASNNNDAFIVIKNEFGTTADEVYLWGSQLEQGDVSTSVIPTSGGDVAARTRAKDDLEISGSDFTSVFNGSEGTFYVETTIAQPEKQYAILRGGSTNQLFIYSNNDTNHLFYDGNPTTSFGLVTANQFSRFALSYKSGNITASLNGSQNTGTPSGLLASSTKLEIGTGYNPDFNGHIKRLIYWPYHSDSL